MSLNLFISYAHADTPFVEQLEADLRKRGFAPWVDRRGLAGGQHWRRQLQEAVDRAQVVLVVLSPEGVSSKYVQNEYGYAEEEGKLILPLYYRPCKIPLELRGIQWIDFQHSYEQGLEALLQVLAQRQPPAPASAAAPPSLSEPQAEAGVLPEPAAVRRPVASNVPVQLTPLIGRQQEIAAVCGSCARARCGW